MVQKTSLSLFLLLLGASLAYTHPVRLHRCHGAAFTSCLDPRRPEALGEAGAALEAGPGVALCGSSHVSIR